MKIINKSVSQCHSIKPIYFIENIDILSFRDSVSTRLIRMHSMSYNIDKNNNVASYLMFSLACNDNQHFAISSSDIKEIIAAPRLHKIPGYQNAVQGAFSLRNHTISVADTCMAIGRASMKEDDKKFIVVVERGDQMFGLLVAKVLSIVTKHSNDLLPPPATLGQKHAISSMFHHEAGEDRRIVSILDTELIINRLK